jgi:hypothetical protein
MTRTTASEMPLHCNSGTAMATLRKHASQLSQAATYMGSQLLYRLNFTGLIPKRILN